MDDIIRIDVDIRGIDMPISFSINPKELKVYFHGEEKDISKDTIAKLLRIVSLWNNMYKGSNVDGPNYLVKITTSKEVVEYKGMGDYPYNFKEFLDLIGKIYGYN